jgi:hypothetical protein
MPRKPDASVVAANSAPRVEVRHTHHVESQVADAVGVIRRCECGQEYILDHVDPDRPGRRTWKALASHR